MERRTRAFPFTSRHFHDETNCLTPAYWRRLRPWLYRRGFGYWEWKARLVEHYLATLADGDILVYSDAGICWNATPAARRRFREYLAMLSGGRDIVAFSQPFAEQEWTKGDVLATLGVYDDESVCRSGQLWAGAFLMRKSAAVAQMVRRWNAVNRRELELITDRRSRLAADKAGFREHRHDQSIFSCLVKTMPHATVPFSETTPAEGQTWDDLRSFPILARREKELMRPRVEVIRNKLLRPWRMLLNVYFRHIRHYYYPYDTYPW